jgi:hypothetical protein
MDPMRRIRAPKTPSRHLLPYDHGSRDATDTHKEHSGGLETFTSLDERMASDLRLIARLALDDVASIFRVLDLAK